MVTQGAAAEEEDDGNKDRARTGNKQQGTEIGRARGINRGEEKRLKKAAAQEAAESSFRTVASWFQKFKAEWVRTRQKIVLERLEKNIFHGWAAFHLFARLGTDLN